jgi:HlyD family secretion protein
LKKWLVLLLLAGIAAAIGWGILRKNEPPKVNFARVKRQPLVSLLPTNGKVEPFEWQAVHCEAAGIVSRLEVHEGQRVAKGTVLAILTDLSRQAEIDAAEAKLAEAKAGVASVESGGRPAELTDIENRLARARFDQQQATIEANTLQRLLDKEAATKSEVQAARDKAQQAQLEIEGLEKRRASLVAKPEVAAANARVQEAEVALNLAKHRATQTSVRAPIDGTVYGLAVQAGAHLNIGDLVCNIGNLDRLRVRVYVDEPELGRVAVGQPVTIRWQALAGKEWRGTVDRKPVSIQALGSRQVGEVVCVIDNPGRELSPGTNVDAEIRTGAVESALVIPREALRHDVAGDYILTVKEGVLERRAVKTGISSITLIQVASGLSEGDMVALPADVPLKPGDRVTAVVAST